MITPHIVRRDSPGVTPNLPGLVEPFLARAGPPLAAPPPAFTDPVMQLRPEPAALAHERLGRRAGTAGGRHRQIDRAGRLPHLSRLSHPRTRCAPSLRRAPVAAAAAPVAVSPKPAAPTKAEREAAERAEREAKTRSRCRSRTGA